MRKFLSLLALTVFFSPWVHSEVSQVPLSVGRTEPAMTMIVLGRDHKLFTSAYNDVSDLDGDGVLDVRFEPTFKYVGIFDPDVCYDYVTGDDARFRPAALAVTNANDAVNVNHCEGGRWSGNYLNYLTASKIDVIRKVLYGGKRAVDDVDRTVLIREFVPTDAHTWGKQYPSLTQLARNATRAEFDISLYTPLAAPSANHRHLFASTNIVTNTTLNLDRPLLRLIRNTSYQIYQWVTVEEPTGVGLCENAAAGCSVEDFVLRVEACNQVMVSGVPTVLENVGENKRPVCKRYGDNYKPIGLLQEFGEPGAIRFGLMTGSYRNNTEGGILRSNIRNFAAEINQNTGQINPAASSDDGIIKSLDSLRIAGIRGLDDFAHNNIHKVIYSAALGNCGTEGVVPQIHDGECRDWGNPLGEIVFETLRYFGQQSGGTATATPAFVEVDGDNTDRLLGLTEPAWRNPFSNSGLTCANNFQLLISDDTPSYDMDQVPGSPFNAHAPSFRDLNMRSKADDIFRNEYGAGSIRAYIGERSGYPNEDLAPTPKDVSSLGNIRGIAPSSPTKAGGYSSSALALYARSTSANMRLRTFAVSIPNDVPKITVSVAGRPVTLQPFGKSVQSLCGPGLSEYYIDTLNPFRPTNQIANFYIERDNGTSGSFVVNYEDQEQGSDYDMDTAVRYNWSVSGDRLTIDANVFSHLSCVEQHVGLAVDGTTEDGVHLLVTGFTNADPDRDEYVTRGVVDALDRFSEASFLTSVTTNPLPGQNIGQYLTASQTVGNPDRLGYRSHVEFTVNNSGATTTTLKDPLWYAAKYGAQLGDALPTEANATSWRNASGGPQNYFRAQNPADLQNQLRQVMGDIERLSRQTSLTSLAVSAGSFSTGLTLYQASFNPEGWSGNIRALSLNEAGTAGTTLWDARTRINTQFSGNAWSGRNVVTWDPYLSSVLYAHKGVPFDYSNIWDAAWRQSMSPTLFETIRDETAADPQAHAVKLIDYIKGDISEEGADRPFAFRQRVDTFNNGLSHFLLGDVVNSTPVYVAAPGMGYPDECLVAGGCGSSWPGATGTRYSQFVQQNQNRTPLIYFGANDGMLHAIRAGNSGGGEEVFAYIPSVVLPNLKELSRANYAHRFFVDGPNTVADVYIDGSWKTVLVGTLGAGGQAIFSLDITDPGNLDKDSVMWEFTDRIDTSITNDKAHSPDLGFTFAKPQVVRLHSDTGGRWAVVVGNGYANNALVGAQGDGAAHLFIIDLESGELIRDIQVGLDATNNGLSSPAVVDVDGDYVADYVYAGDLLGNLWKFNLTSNTPSEWDVENGNTPMVATGQPITHLPAVARHPYGGVIVVFGTGKFFETEDNSPTGQADQYYYGVRDELTGSPTVINSGNMSSAIVDQVFDTDASGNRAASNNQIDWNTQKGWRIPLKDSANANNIGERTWGDPVILQDRVYITTARPLDPTNPNFLCNGSGLQGGMFSLRVLDGGGRGSLLEPDNSNYTPREGLSFVGKMLMNDAVNSPSVVLGSDRDIVLLRSTSSGDIQSDRTQLSGSGRQSWREVKETLMCR